MKTLRHSATKTCLIVLLVVGCLPAWAQQSELRKLAEEDQASRLGTRKVTRTDEERIRLVLQYLAAGRVVTPEDKFDAALVLQHTGLDFVEGRLVSKSPDNYLLAHYLATQSYEAGFEDARVLVAQTLDRYLSFTVGRQKYGTNRIINQQTGKEELVPIDRSTTDSERAKYGVPPLAELLKRYPEQKPTNKKDTPGGF